jgi:hypothetical protein
MLQNIVCLIFAFGLLVGCATDRGRTQAEGTAVGCGAGAGIGALAGAIIGGGDGAKKGAVIGGGVGCVAGLAAGIHVANQKEKFANREDYLDAVTANAKKVNEDTRLYNESLSVAIRQFDIKTESLVLQYKQKKVSKSQLVKQEEMLQNRMEVAEKKLKIIKDEIEIQHGVLDKEKKAGSVASDNNRFHIMQSQINELERNKAELEQGIGKLASIKNRVSV